MKKRIIIQILVAVVGCYLSTLVALWIWEETSGGEGIYGRLLITSISTLLAFAMTVLVPVARVDFGCESKETKNKHQNNATK